MDESHRNANQKNEKLNILEGRYEDSQVSWRTGAVGAPPERKVISNCSATTLAHEKVQTFHHFLCSNLASKRSSAPQV